MSDSALAQVLLVLLLLVGFAQFLGYLFVKLRQPKVVGEILAGIVLGPALLGAANWGLRMLLIQQRYCVGRRGFRARLQEDIDVS
jgi:Kef-type K+ transport system membrane component KefB